MTNASRRIRNAWHFCHALILVIKVVCGSIGLRCSPLKRALCLIHKNQQVVLFDSFGIPFSFVGNSILFVAV
ncbi:TPA: DUF3265 domain-containing protein [Vibrio cholerae]|nr:DUF3265 domain-containing protein [Vibrio cholerae]